MKFKIKRTLTLLIAIICVVLFLSMSFMMNNIDDGNIRDDRQPDDDKLVLLHFKDNILKLKDQLDANEKKIDLLKDMLAQVSNQKLSKDDKLIPNLVAKRATKNPIKFIKNISLSSSLSVLTCPQSTRYIANSNADIQMSAVLDRVAFDNPDGGVWKQGYPITYNENQWSEDNKLLVFVVPHSHTDPGWIKTFDQYYQDQTSHILNLMVEKLVEYPKMRFVYAEMSFFTTWWQYASQNMRDTVKKLLDEKRLEILTGGWVMSDEANAHYFAMLDQLIEGNQWLSSELDYQPVTGWAIDPFGYSPTLAYLLKSMSFENMLIQRTHYSIKKEFSIKKDLEFMWRQQWDSKGSTDILCHMMPFYSYDIPHTCGPDPKICCQFDFRRMSGSRYSCPWRINPAPIDDVNVHERASTLLDQYRKKSLLYNSKVDGQHNNVVLIPLGDDFRYDTAEEWDLQYKNYEKLFDYMNQKKDWNVKAQFATLTDYFTALRTRSAMNDRNFNSQPQNVPFPSLSGDFFVYADRDDHYWSGYFTSRPFYKMLDREVEHHQRLAEILFSLALSEAKHVDSSVLEKSDLSQLLIKSRRNLGLFQHHDGITGTAKDHVVVDYGRRLLDSLNSLKKVIIRSSEFLLSSMKSAFKFHDSLIFDLDETRQEHHDIPRPNVIDLSMGKRTVYFFNSLGQSRKSIVTLHVTTAYVAVFDQAGRRVRSQISPKILNTDGENLKISNHEFLLSFMVETLALGFSSFYLEEETADKKMVEFASVHVFNNKKISYDDDASSPNPFEITHNDAAGPFISNEQLQLRISAESGLAKSIKWMDGSTNDERMELSFVKYGTTHAKEKSGLYLFIPGTEAEYLYTTYPTLTITRGWLYSEAMSIFPLVTHHIRCSSIQSGLPGAGFDIMNIVDVRGEGNTEIAMRMQTDVKNNDGTFYTDLNGFQVIKRKYLPKLPIQANFYPMPSMAYLQDDSQRFSLLTAQSLGVASLKTGRLEVMLDRRLDQDDNRGAEQPLHDNKKTPNKFKIVIEKPQNPPPTFNSDSQMGFFTPKSHFASLDL
ncbi:hypothetical protein HELRODRAFT_110840, partial [Helobdella robusta]|uniref:Alpha-mannosidase n=1 Tax=Helobdella robusta TaxID=6412 RepID=T1EF56_HELRO